MTWSNLDDQPAAPNPSQLAPSPSLPPLPPFSPHPSTIEGGGSVDNTQTSDLGILASLAGTWAGEGLNAIWTPSQQAVTQSDRFLQLAKTTETQVYAPLDGVVPNRGLLQPDLFMSALQYTQQIASNGKSLHFEHGVWLNVPATTFPAVQATVARMASIPHGTTINAQGVATTLGSPSEVTIPLAALTPFQVGSPSSLVDMDETKLETVTSFRTQDPVANGFDQATLNDVNTFIRSHIPQGATAVSKIDVTTQNTPELPGGGVANTAFLAPNANVSIVTATVWLFTSPGENAPSTMLYTQTVLLDFNGLSWPHVTVGFLERTPVQG